MSANSAGPAAGISLAVAPDQPPGGSTESFSAAGLASAAVRGLAARFVGQLTQYYATAAGVHRNRLTAIEPLAMSRSIRRAAGNTGRQVIDIPARGRVSEATAGVS